MAAAEPIRIDEGGRLLTHLPCVRCDYDLLGAEAEGRCPECGLAVGRSTRGSWLRYCEPDWLRTVWGGLNRLAVVVACGLGLAGLIYSGWVTNLRHPLPEWLVILVPLVPFCTGVVVGVRGMWVATVREPDPLSPPRFWHPARVCRACLVGSIAAAVLVALSNLAVHGTSEFLNGLVVVPWMLLIVSVASLLVYARALAKRVPNNALSLACLLTAAVAAVVWTLAVWLMHDWFGWLTLLEVWLTPGGGGGGAGGPVFWSNGFWRYYTRVRTLANVATLAVLAALPLLFVWFYVVLLAEARRARATWAARPAILAARDGIPRPAEATSGASSR